MFSNYFIISSLPVNKQSELLSPNSCKQTTWRRILFSIRLFQFSTCVRATPCSSSGESIVSIRRLVYVTLRRWPSSMQVGKEHLPDLRTRRSPKRSDIYQMSYWYNWLSWWWWARGCSKHVEHWNKRIEKRILRQVGCLQELYQNARSTKHKILPPPSIPSNLKIWIPRYMGISINDFYKISKNFFMNLFHSVAEIIVVVLLLLASYFRISWGRANLDEEITLLSSVQKVPTCNTDRDIWLS